MTIPVLIPTDKIKDVENFVSDSIEKALKFSGNHYNLDDVLKQLYEGKAQLWILWNDKRKTKYQGCIVSKILERPNTKSLNLFIVTGQDRKLWQDKINILEDYAKQQGCSHLETYARPGWSRILKKHNYKTTHYLLEKKLED
jgi:hypothetical protein|tara:strand:+ start:504 stop:929 length:426 start_codon:yes stop_codon:yes gene_type:complete